MIQENEIRNNEFTVVKYFVVIQTKNIQLLGLFSGNDDGGVNVMSFCDDVESLV